VHELYSIDELQHEVTDVLSLQRALAEADGFIEVAIRAKLENKVDVVLRLERLEQVHNVGVRGNAEVDVKLLGTLVDGDDGRAGIGGRRLGDDLDGHIITGYKVLGLEDHSKGAMVEGGDGFISSIEYDAVLKLVAHTIHWCDSGEDKNQLARRDSKGRPGGE
jgi:hypothetical protein